MGFLTDLKVYNYNCQAWDLNPEFCFRICRQSYLIHLKTTISLHDTSSIPSMCLPFVTLARHAVRVGSEVCVLLVDAVVGQVHEPVGKALHRRRISTGRKEDKRIFEWRSHVESEFYFSLIVGIALSLLHSSIALLLSLSLFLSLSASFSLRWSISSTSISLSWSLSSPSFMWCTNGNTPRHWFIYIDVASSLN